MFSDPLLMGADPSPGLVAVEHEEHPGQDRMILHCEIEPDREAMDTALIADLREVTKLRGEVAFAAPGGLPNDGKVIEDKRVY